MNVPAFSIGTTPTKLKLRVEDFLLLDREGAFAGNTRTELIEGELYFVNAQFRRHAWIKRVMARAMDDVLEGRQDGLTALTECSVYLGPESLPEPDIVLTTEPRGDGPVPLASAKLIVEVSDTTLDIDLGRKQRIYAQAGIAEYWVVDVEGERVIRLTEPSGETYAQRDETPLAGPIEAATVAGLRVVMRL